MALTAIVTNAGRAALVNASNTGTAPVTIAQVGLTATAVVPGVGITALPGEYKRIATISGDVVADDTIHLIVRDESADVFTVRSFALYLADGTLFAIYGQAGVILEKSAQAIMLLAIDVQFADVAAAMLTFGNANFLNPPATTEMQGVVELTTVAEAQAGIDALRALTPVAAKAAILGWLLAQDGSGSGLDADLLDGQDGSYYANIPQRLGYTPANRAGDTFTGNLAISKTGSQELHFSGTGTYKWRAIGTNLAGSGGNFHLQYTTDNFGSSFVSGLMLTTAGFASSQGQGIFWGPNNDGAGSGLDADLLDGQDGSYYSNITQRLGYTPVNRAGDTITGNLTVSAGGGYAQLQATGDIIATRSGGTTGTLYLNAGATRYLYNDGGAYWLNGQQLYINNSMAWNAGNDGAGSGLDADLLDGQDGSYYSNIVQRLGFTPLNKAGDTASGKVSFVGGTTGNNPLGTATSGLGEIEVRGNGTGAAMMTFHRPGSYATYFGLDTDNNLKLGGWSLGAASYSLWHSGNDGAGSGLDADLLDGLQASQFLRNYNGTWLNSEEGTPRFHFINAGATYMRVTAAFIWQNSANGNIASLDESGNIWLNGQVDATRFLARANGDGQAVKIGDDAWLGDVNISNGFRVTGIQDPTRGFINFGNWDTASLGRIGSGHLIYNGNTIWHAGNDGSGSGLDADLLDGYQAGDLAKYGDFTGGNQSLGASGYQKLPGGLILQWGTITLGDDSYGTVTFPIAFPNACRSIQASRATEVGNGNAQANGPLPYSVTNTQAQFWNAAAGGPYAAWWFALGN